MNNRKKFGELRSAMHALPEERAKILSPIRGLADLNQQGLAELEYGRSLVEKQVQDVLDGKIIKTLNYAVFVELMDDPKEFEWKEHLTEPVELVLDGDDLIDLLNDKTQQEVLKNIGVKTIIIEETYKFIEDIKRSNAKVFCEFLMTLGNPEIIIKGLIDKESYVSKYPENAFIVTSSDDGKREAIPAKGKIENSSDIHFLIKLGAIGNFFDNYLGNLSNVYVDESCMDGYEGKQYSFSYKDFDQTLFHYLHSKYGTGYYITRKPAFISSSKPIKEVVLLKGETQDLSLEKHVCLQKIKNGSDKTLTVNGKLVYPGGIFDINKDDYSLYDKNLGEYDVSASDNEVYIDQTPYPPMEILELGEVISSIKTIDVTDCSYLSPDMIELISKIGKVSGDLKKTLSGEGLELEELQELESQGVDLSGLYINGIELNAHLSNSQDLNKLSYEKAIELVNFILTSDIELEGSNGFMIPLHSRLDLRNIVAKNNDKGVLTGEFVGPILAFNAMELRAVHVLENILGTNMAAFDLVSDFEEDSEVSEFVSYLNEALENTKTSIQVISFKDFYFPEGSKIDAPFGTLDLRSCEFDSDETFVKFIKGFRLLQELIMYDCGYEENDVLEILTEAGVKIPELNIIY